MRTVLETNRLSKRYGDFLAINDVSIQVEAGSIHGIIGPNGAGKTTLFNCLAGAVAITAGKITLQGADITRLPQHARPLAGLGRSFQITSLFSELTVFENLRLARQALSPAKGFMFWRAVETAGPAIDAVTHILRRIGLTAEKGTVVSALSHGQQRVLEVGMALMAHPRVLLLDEPTSGMGVNDVPQMIRLLRLLKEECTIVLIEHNVGLVVEVCDMVTVMQSGAVIFAGTPKEVSEDAKVKAAYLGEGM